MKLYTVSKVTGREYCPEDCIRVLNIKQVAFYLENDLPLEDIYNSIDYKTREPVLVFLFNKKESRDLYALWLQRKALSN